MTKYDELDLMVEKGNGYLNTSDVLQSDISKTTLAGYVKARGMERVEHGMYLAKDAWRDELYQISQQNNKVIFSHETALYLHGLMEREPAAVSVTTDSNYNGTHLRKRGIRVYRVRKELYELGAVMVETNFGNIVRAYDKERTICDILQHKDEMDVQVFRYAMREYMSIGGRNLRNLMKYAKIYGMEDKVRMYTEVMI